MNSDENMVMQNTSFDMKGYIHALYDLELALQKESLRIKGLMDMTKEVQTKCNDKISEINEQYDYLTNQAAIKVSQKSKSFENIIAVLLLLSGLAISGVLLWAAITYGGQIESSLFAVLVFTTPVLLWFVIPFAGAKIIGNKHRKRSLDKSICAVVQEKSLKIQEITEFRDELIKKIQEYKLECVKIKEALRAKLDDMYSNDVILPQYRSYEAIDCFKDYFDAEMGTSLTGPDGAYKFFEGRRNAGMIVRRFEEITDKLSANMNEAYKSLSASINIMHSDISKSINNLDSSIAQARIAAERASNAADLAAFNSFLNLL